MQFPRKKLSAAIKARRKAMGLTQAKAAEAVDIETRSFQQIETGKSIPSAKLFYRLARTLNLSVDAVFFDKPRESEVYDAIVRLLSDCSERDLHVLLATVEAMTKNKLDE